MIVVLDASTFVSAALKMDSIPERALPRAVTAPNRLLLSRAVEAEYREVIFRPKFDRFVAVARRQLILDIVVVAAERIEPTETIRECRDPKDDKYLALAAAGGASSSAAMSVTCSRCTPGGDSRSYRRLTFSASPDRRRG